MEIILTPEIWFISVIIGILIGVALKCYFSFPGKAKKEEKYIPPTVYRKR